MTSVQKKKNQALAVNWLFFFLATDPLLRFLFSYFYFILFCNLQFLKNHPTYRWCFYSWKFYSRLTVGYSETGENDPLLVVGGMLRRTHRVAILKTRREHSSLNSVVSWYIPRLLTWTPPAFKPLFSQTHSSDRFSQLFVALLEWMSRTLWPLRLDTYIMHNCWLYMYVLLYIVYHSSDPKLLQLLFQSFGTLKIHVENTCYIQSKALKTVSFRHISESYRIVLFRASIQIFRNCFILI